MLYIKSLEEGLEVFKALAPKSELKSLKSSWKTRT